MKKFAILFLLTGLVIGASAKSNPLRAYLSYSGFYSPVDGPYLETYLSILGKSVNFVSNGKGKFQGTVMVTMLFKQNDSIKAFRKYELSSTEITDTANIDFIMFDQQRITLPNGKYLLELQLADKNRETPPFKAIDEIAIAFDKQKVSFSGIELVESFSKASENSATAKSGYDFIPYQDDFFPEKANKVTFYCELYNMTGQIGYNVPFAISTAIQSIETGKAFDDFYRVKRETAKDVNVVFSEFDISALPSGNYNLVVSARDKENREIVAQSLFFQRSNPGLKFDDNALGNIMINNSFVSKYANDDTLRENIRCCFPIASANEKLFINNNLGFSNLLSKQQFFLNFWLQRNAADPENAWNKYHEVVVAVERDFGSTNKKGYETDRGRVYLQYGAPNQRIIEPINPSNYPYEIWQYYQVGKQTNLKFVFYTRDRALNDYQLAHSTAYGEIKNVNWQYELKQKISPRDTDSERYLRAMEESEWGEHSGEYFNIRK